MGRAGGPVIARLLVQIPSKILNPRDPQKKVATSCDPHGKKAMKEKLRNSRWGFYFSVLSGSVFCCPLTKIYNNLKGGLWKMIHALEIKCNSFISTNFASILMQIHHTEDDDICVMCFFLWFADYSQGQWDTVHFNVQVHHPWRFSACQQQQCHPGGHVWVGSEELVSMFQTLCRR